MAFALNIGGVDADVIGGDKDLAIRLILRARQLAPCLPEFDDDTPERTAVVAILKGVAARAASIGTGTIASQGRNGTNRSYRDVRSAFFPEDISGLRLLCPDGATQPTRAMPVGSFPTERPLSKLFPEGGYS
ncbi:MAG: MPMin1 gp44 [Microbacterium sp.]|jgi:hypothetical protein|nr:MPMin1 gp44 [Microbacterium sp.]